MTRAVIKFTDGGFTNIPATEIRREEATIFVYDGAEMKGFFDLGYLRAAYLSETREDK